MVDLKATAVYDFLYTCHAHIVTNLISRIGDPTPYSCMGSSENTATVCLNQEVIFTCRTSGTNFLRWRTSATGFTNVLFVNTDPIPTQAPLENSMRGISFTAVLQSRSTNVFTSILSANIDSNAYDGINITCDDITGGSMAVLPLQLVNSKFCVI